MNIDFNEEEILYILGGLDDFQYGMTLGNYGLPKDDNDVKKVKELIQKIRQYYESIHCT